MILQWMMMRMMMVVQSHVDEYVFPGCCSKLDIMSTVLI